MKKLISILFVFALVFSLVFAEESFFQKTDNVLVSQEGGFSTFTFQESENMELLTLNKKDNYGHVKPSSDDNNAFLKIDANGTLVEADLTASEATTWNFDNKQYRVPEGGRLLYTNGSVKLYPPSNNSQSEFEITDSKNPATNYGKFTLNEDSEVTISREGIVYGKNFGFEGMNIKGRFGSDGKIQKLSEGSYNLFENSELSFKNSGLTIRTTTNPVRVSIGDYFQTEGQTEVYYDGDSKFGTRTLFGESVELFDSRRDIAFLFRDGAEGYSSATSLSLDTSRGGIAKLFTPDETIMEANGDIINIKRGPIYIPYTDIKVISFSEQTTYFSDEGGGRYHAFYALSDPNKGPAVAYVADANFPAEGVSKLDDVGYCGKVGMVYQFAEFANPLKR